MSEEFRDYSYGHHELTLTKYWGGEIPGKCLQITGRNCDDRVGYVGVTLEEALDLAIGLLEFIRQEGEVS